MSMIAPNSVYHLVDGVLDKGLSHVAEFVENILKRSVIIADHDGRIHYPEEVSYSGEVDDVFVSIPTILSGRDFYYQNSSGSLFYRISYNDSCAFIIAQDLPVEEISRALALLIDTKLAIKCYFCKLHKESDRFEQELAEYLFADSKANIRDLAKLSENRLEMDQLYVVTLVEIEEGSDITQIQQVRSYLYEYLKKNKFEAVPISWSNYICIIIPVGSTVDKLDEALDWPAMITSKEAVEGKFAISLSQGIGQVHSLADLRHSFYQARVALTLPKLLGKNHFVQKFSDLGIYYPIFCQELKEIKRFCLQTLGKIIEHDEKTDGDLLPTLRNLLDSNVNMKSTAESLFIHVNTLYYRVNKIEELLNIDFSNMDNRVNLFIAIKVWDTLNATGLNPRSL
ncbi:MAG: helix-turn-helix domain-containing protein [Syntrophomonadaceae bacterium]|jgi:sugar diacid utilization regulator